MPLTQTISFCSKHFLLFPPLPSSSCPPSPTHLRLPASSCPQHGGYGSIGYGYDWKTAEAEKNLLRTHTTAVSSRMLYRLAQVRGGCGGSCVWVCIGGQGAGLAAPTHHRSLSRMLYRLAQHALGAACCIVNRGLGREARG